MSSYSKGKAQAISWVHETVPKGSTCLDVGACDGLWWKLLNDHLVMDACEAYWPNVEKYLMEKYRNVFAVEAVNLRYQHYDLVIMGDVLEHMNIADAMNTVAWAKDHSDYILVAVPYLYHQRAIYGNPYEEHIQDDLTPEIFNRRYPGFTVLWADDNYGYYVWTKVGSSR